MKKLILIALLTGLFILTGCNDGDIFNAGLDQEFIDNIFNNLQAKDIITKKIPANSNIYIYNLDTVEKNSMSTFIEDNIMNQLASYNYNILERDPIIVKKILQENANENYSIYYKESRLVDLISKLSVATFNITEVKSKEIINFLEKDRNNTFLAKTFLKSADYIIAYRLLEAHMTYSNHKEPWLISFYQNTFGNIGDFFNSAIKNVEQTKTIARNGKIKVHIRILDARTGEIKFARNLQSKYNNHFEANVKDSFNDFHYYFTKEKNSSSTKILNMDKNELAFAYKNKGLSLSNHAIGISYKIKSNYWIEGYADSVDSPFRVGVELGYPIALDTKLAAIPFAGAYYSDAIKYNLGVKGIYKFTPSIHILFDLYSVDSIDIINNRSYIFSLKYLL